MGKVLAVDWGARRVGLALSDETRTLARPLANLEVAAGGSPVESILRLVKEEGVDTVVVGNPVHMNGRPSPSGMAAGRLAAALKAGLPGVRVEFRDERLTSRVAESILRERGEKPTRRTKGRLDQVSAALLLQEYLDGGVP